MNSSTPEERINASAGQTRLSPQCRTALAQPMDVPIYYPDYYRAELEAAAILQELAGTRTEVLLVTGNATHAVEMALLSLLEPGEGILTVNGGIFGQVLTEVARIIGANPVEMRIPYGQAVTAARIEQALEEHPQVKAVGIVHIETSTGVICPLAELAQVVRRHEKLLIVDAVSSLGAVPLRIDEWGVDVLISSGQKALNAPQGLAILAVSERAWKAYEARRTGVPGVCLDLGTWREYRELGVRRMLAAFQGSVNPTDSGRDFKVIHGPSPSGPLVFGLLGALHDLQQEGFERAFHRQAAAGKAVREGVQALGLAPLAGEAVAAPCVTTILLPEAIDEFTLRKEMYEKEGVALGAGPVEIGLNAFRIGTMGGAACPRVVLPVLAALGRILVSLGQPCDPQAAVRAAEAVFARPFSTERREA